MIRSRSIPSVLSRATGDGIHAILLIDSVGELIGSHGKPPPQHPSSVDNGGVAGSAAAAAVRNEKHHWPLDAASIGALISEVAGDYRRMGEELLFLDPHFDSQRQSIAKGDGGPSAGLHRQDRAGSSGGEGFGGEVTSLLQSGAGGKNGNDKQSSGTNLKSLVIELDYGVVGVASAGPDFYVIALADSTVQHGALAGRLRSLGTHVREALSQLD